MKKFRLHIISLPHTSTTKQFESCAYSSKIRKLSNMMYSLGHEVYLYSGPENEADCTEHIPIVTKEQQIEWFGDYSLEGFYPITWGPDEVHWKESNKKAIEEISKRIQPRDMILVIAGWCQKEIADAFPNHATIEAGVGYYGVFADYVVYESYSHMHNCYGMQKSDDGRFYDCVIPNYFDPNDFKFRNWNEKEDYYVFLGRFIPRKGVEIAVEATRKLGAKLIMAGQGCEQDGNTFYGENNFSVSGDHLEHIGHVNVLQRSELLSKAKACFMPTTYLEPFGGVAIEALMCGTPVIASDFGAFTSTIPHGKVGYRFRTIGEAAYYASDECLNLLELKKIRQYAIDNYSMWNLRWKYQDYFEQIAGLYDGSNDFYGDWHGSLMRYT